MCDILRPLHIPQVEYHPLPRVRRLEVNSIIPCPLGPSRSERHRVALLILCRINRVQDIRVPRVELLRRADPAILNRIRRTDLEDISPRSLPCRSWTMRHALRVRVLIDSW